MEPMTVFWGYLWATLKGIKMATFPLPLIKSLLWLAALVAVLGESTLQGTCSGTDPGSCQDETAVDATLFGVIQTIPDVNATSTEKEIQDRLETLAVLRATAGYMAKRRVFKVKDPCRNHDFQCSYWAAIGECQGNTVFMMEQCSPACQFCERVERERASGPKRRSRKRPIKEKTKEEPVVTEEEPTAAEDSEHEDEFDTTWFGEEQNTIDDDPKVLAVINASLSYMKEQELEYEEISSICQNQHENCSYWVTLGECEANEEYMKFQCAPACRSCDKLHFESRCPPFKDEVEYLYNSSSAAAALNAWQPGDLHRWFTALTTNETLVQKYHPVIHSQPTTVDENGVDDAPWVVTVPNLLTPHECRTLIELGAGRGYERSGNTGEVNKVDGQHETIEDESRTSTNAWCLEECFNNATTQAVLQKIEELTGIPDANSEHLQLLRYQTGQYYHTHHDYIPFHLHRAQGVRLMTVFIYLNTLPEGAGGGTNFPQLDITVNPVQGTVLIWPSVLSSNPNQQDHRTTHQALPVLAFDLLEGTPPQDADEHGRYIKYAANSW
jgi:prolyl 4-hydroxylase